MDSLFLWICSPDRLIDRSIGVAAFATVVRIGATVVCRAWSCMIRTFGTHCLHVWLEPFGRSVGRHLSHYCFHLFLFRRRRRLFVVVALLCRSSHITHPPTIHLYKQQEEWSKRVPIRSWPFPPDVLLVRNVCMYVHIDWCVVPTTTTTHAASSSSSYEQQQQAALKPRPCGPWSSSRYGCMRGVVCVYVCTVIRSFVRSPRDCMEQRSAKEPLTGVPSSPLGAPACLPDPSGGRVHCDDTIDDSYGGNSRPMV